MTNLSHQEKAIIFSLYANCPVFRNNYWASTIPSVDCHGNLGHRTTNPDWYMTLIPLAQISDEHAIQLLTKIMHCSVFDGAVKHLSDGVSVKNQSSAASLFWKYLRYDQYMQLVAWEYAVPLFFGIDHP